MCACVCAGSGCACIHDVCAGSGCVYVCVCWIWVCVCPCVCWVWVCTSPRVCWIWCVHMCAHEAHVPRELTRHSGTMKPSIWPVFFSFACQAAQLPTLVPGLTPNPTLQPPSGTPQTPAVGLAPIARTGPSLNTWAPVSQHASLLSRAPGHRLWHLKAAS